LTTDSSSASRFSASDNDTGPVEPMAEARAWLDQALARIDELSAADRERLTYLEQRSADSKEATEDMFHAANNALFIMSVELELLARHIQPECKHAEVKKWISTLSAKIREIKSVNQRVFSTNAGGPLYRIHSFVSLRSIVERTLETYEDVARKKRIPVSWQVPDFAAITIWTDAVAIGTVLDNLVSNAIKFSKPDKRMTVTISRSGTNLVCSVCDEGPGLSKEDLARIFQRGARLTPKPTGGEPSSGYGLAITRDLVRKLGGRIWCESVEGKGTTFTFSLPTHPKLAIERRATPRTAAERRAPSSDVLPMN
jgi:two-component system, sensor histidine kinase LadS